MYTRLVAGFSTVLVIAGLAMLAGTAQADPLSTAGTDFWLGFPTDYVGYDPYCTGCNPTQTLYISSNTSTSGSVTVPGLSFTQTFTVTPGATTSVALPPAAEMRGDHSYNGSYNGSDTIENRGIHVTALAPIVVYGENDYEATTGAYLALPTDAIGTSYTVLAFGAGAGGNSEFSVVASQNNTTVTITPSVDGGIGDTRPAGIPYTVTLNEGEEYQLQATTNPEDLTGTTINASAPVSVYGGQMCANVPSVTYNYCDYLVQQLPPEDAWGTAFFSEPLQTRLDGDDFEMVADQNNTEVKLNGNLVTTLNAGQHYSQEVAGASEFTSNKPILLGQYANSWEYDHLSDREADPLMMIVPPTWQFDRAYTIATPALGTAFTNYLNLVAPKTAVGSGMNSSILIDGTAVPTSDFQPIVSSAFEGAQVAITPGSHVISSSGGQRFIAWVYGFATLDGYGYPAGSPQAQEPEFPGLGRCKKVAAGAGQYGVPGCNDAPSAGGRYEWLPGAARNRFTSKGHLSTFKTVGGLEIDCTHTSDSGEYVGESEDLETITFRACGYDSGAGSCTSGLGKGFETAPLRSIPGFIDKATGSVGISLEPVSGKVFAEVECGSQSQKALIEGSVVAPIMQVDINKMTKTFKENFTASGGLQVPEQFENEPNDTLTCLIPPATVPEQCALTSADKITNEEKLEIRTEP